MQYFFEDLLCMLQLDIQQTNWVYSYDEQKDFINLYWSYVELLHFKQQCHTEKKMAVILFRKWCDHTRKPPPPFLKYNKNYEYIYMYIQLIKLLTFLTISYPAF